MAEPAHQSPRPGASAASALHQALIRLAQPAGAPPHGKPDTLSAAVLREISETVLPREITLCIGDRPAAVLTVAQRRLAGLSLGGAAAGTAAAENPKTAAQLFAAGLRRLESEGLGQEVSFRRRPCAAPQGASSCSVRRLAEALTAAGGGRLDHFRAQAAPQAAAWLHCPRNGGQAQGNGPAELRTRLDAVRQALTAKSTRPASARMPVPKPDCLLLPVTPQLHILTASDSGALLLLALPPDEARTQAAVWRGIYG
ncbi:hypothetical protein KUV26_17540 [Leisingera daeponensis]|uniref:Flagellar hook-length control protein FliK n=1 Tax=Leisingera daeponensis TaxID=405746 RepID=A0ABS7NJA8_9RHOB|nr:hypothetical protein [Leisingera daeponensis]MBY6141245.1 hypothetical protein [Leisingera daeponensis]